MEDDDANQSEYDKAVRDWECVPSIITDTERKCDSGQHPLSSVVSVISAKDAWRKVQNDESLKQFKDDVVLSVTRSKFATFKLWLFGARSLNAELVDEKEKVFCFAACPLKESSPVHLSMLQSVYMQLTGAAPCPRFGSHWETIGFQGHDPATDLRGGGCLALLHLLHLTEYRHSKDWYALSQHDTQNFPFCVMGINITRHVLAALRGDYLNRLCNERQSVMTVVLDVFVAGYAHLMRQWKTQKATITDSGRLLKDVEYQLKNNPKQLLALHHMCITSKNEKAKSVGSKRSAQFDDMADLEEGDDPNR